MTEKALPPKAFRDGGWRSKLILRMPVRIAIPEPTSRDAEYNERSLPTYLKVLKASAIEPVRLPLAIGEGEVGRILSATHGVLLPGSRYDVDPQIYGEYPIPQCGEADLGRSALDDLLLRDAFHHRKPILAICYGVQVLNTWRNGSLVQDVETQLQTRVNHRPGRDVRKAHRVQIEPGSRLAAIAPLRERDDPWVNSSHHQAVRKAGNGLRVSAVSPVDGVIEAIELDSIDHFVLGVQWHPERTFSASRLSRAIFASFAQAARAWELNRMKECGTRR